MLLITETAFTQTSCRKFVRGKFNNIENGVTQSVIERNDSIQVEQAGEKRIKLKIVWMDECSYRLIFLEGNDAFWKSRGRDKPTPDLIVRITKVEGNSYLQEAKFVTDTEFRYISKMEKVE